MKRIFLILLLSSAAVSLWGKSKYDVIVAGGGTGGYSAAVQAARSGCDVLLLEESDWLGGQMSSAGVGTMDEGTPRIRQNGIYKEFCTRVSEYYSGLGKENNLCYWEVGSFSVEPRVAQKVIYDMIDQANKGGKGHVDVMLLSKVVSVRKDGNKVVGVSVETGLKKKSHKDFDCHILVDATEYGDVIPLTGARYMIAKHTSDSFDKQSNVQKNTWTAIIKEYKDGIPENLRVTVKPKTYDQSRWHFEYIKKTARDSYYTSTSPISWNSIAYYRGLPDSSVPGNSDYTAKTDLNIAQNDVAVKVGDMVDPNARFLNEIALREKTLALLYYIQNELGLPWSVDVAEGYATPFNRYNVDKIIDYDPTFAPYRDVLVNFPVLPYVRESFRIIGQHILISSEISRVKGPVHFEDAVSINDYPEDLHGSTGAADMDLEIDPLAMDSAEIGDWGARVGEFQLPLRSFIPETLDGFLPAEKNISQSRLVNGATRLQPSTMINGQLVGNIAALAVKYNCQPRDLPAVLVQWEQVNCHSPLWFKPINDIPVGTDIWKYAQIALAKGYLTLLDGTIFYPWRELTEDELNDFISKYSLAGDVTPQSHITRIEMAKMLVDRDLRNAINRLRELR